MPVSDVPYLFQLAHYTCYVWLNRYVITSSIDRRFNSFKYRYDFYFFYVYYFYFVYSQSINYLSIMLIWMILLQCLLPWFVASTSKQFIFYYVFIRLTPLQYYFVAFHPRIFIIMDSHYCVRSLINFPPSDLVRVGFFTIE